MSGLPAVDKTPTTLVSVKNPPILIHEGHLPSDPPTNTSPPHAPSALACPPRPLTVPTSSSRQKTPSRPIWRALDGVPIRRTFRAQGTLPLPPAPLKSGTQNRGIMSADTRIPAQRGVEACPATHRAVQQAGARCEHLPNPARAHALAHAVARAEHPLSPRRSPRPSQFPSPLVFATPSPQLTLVLAPVIERPTKRKPSDAAFPSPFPSTWPISFWASVSACTARVPGMGMVGVI